MFNNRFFGACLALLLVLATSVASAQERDWSGFYLGAVGAYGTGSASVPDTVLQPYGDVFSFSGTGAGELFGLTAGYDHDFGRVIVGVRADAMFGDVSGTTLASFPNHTFGLTEGSSTFRVSNPRGLNLRLGFDAGRWMPYGVIGASVASVSVSGDYSHLGHNYWSHAATERRVGLNLGLGVEYMLTPRSTIGVEYLHTNYGSVSAENYDHGLPTGDMIAYGVQTGVWRLSYNMRF